MKKTARPHAIASLARRANYYPICSGRISMATINVPSIWNSGFKILLWVGHAVLLHWERRCSNGIVFQRRIVSSIRKLYHGIRLTTTRKTHQTAKWQKLEGCRNKSPQEFKQTDLAHVNVAISNWRLYLKGLYQIIPKQTLNGHIQLVGSMETYCSCRWCWSRGYCFFLAILLHSKSGFLCSSSKLGRKMGVGKLPMLPRWCTRKYKIVSTVDPCCKFNVIGTMKPSSITHVELTQLGATSQVQ